MGGQTEVTENVSSMNLRQPPISDYNLTGFLTWNANVGRIAWELGTPSEDPAVRPANEAYTRNAGLGWTEYTRTDSEAGIPTDEFVSAPFPHLVHLNVSRPIELDVYSKFIPRGANLQFQGLYHKCPQFQVQLWSGTKLIAGQLAANLPLNSNIDANPPPGYCLFFARMHPEADRIDAGEVLKLRLLYREGSGPPPYGTAGSQASVIRFPFYGPEEVVFRIAGVAAGGQGPGVGQQPTVMALAVAAPILSSRIRGRSAAIALIVAASGCLGSSSDPLSDAPAEDGPQGVGRSTLIPSGETGATNGTLLGQVTNDVGQALSRAHVSLLQTTHFGQTDRHGRFQFEGLTPSVYHVRIDQPGYISFEGTADVVAGNITRLDIMLARPLAGAGGLRPHAHDYWGGLSSIKLMDEDVHMDWQLRQTNGLSITSTGETGVCRGHNPNPTFGRGSICWVDFRLPPMKDGTGGRILPGTYDIEISLDWTKTPLPVHRMGVGVRHMADTQNATLFYPRHAGEPTHIRSGWEMTDAGHQTFTGWRFLFYIPTNSGQGNGGGAPGGILADAEATGGGAQLMSGPVRVKVTIHKGVVPLEPAHRDFWQDHDRLVVLNGAEVSSVKACPRGTSMTAQCQFPHKDLTWTPSGLVPPGAGSLDVLLEQNKAGTPAVNWGLVYRPANVPAPTTQYGNPTYTFERHRPMPPPTTTPEGKLFKLVLEPDESDPFYASESNWHFALDDGTTADSTLAEDITFMLTIFANRDSTFNASQEM